MTLFVSLFPVCMNSMCVCVYVCMCLFVCLFVCLAGMLFVFDADGVVQVSGVMVNVNEEEIVSARAMASAVTSCEEDDVMGSGVSVPVCDRNTQTRTPMAGRGVVVFAECVLTVLKYYMKARKRQRHPPTIVNTLTIPILATASHAPKKAIIWRTDTGETLPHSLHLPADSILEGLQVKVVDQYDVVVEDAVERVYAYWKKTKQRIKGDDILPPLHLPKVAGVCSFSVTVLCKTQYRSCNNRNRNSNNNSSSRNSNNNNNSSRSNRGSEGSRGGGLKESFDISFDVVVDPVEPHKWGMRTASTSATATATAVSCVVRSESISEKGSKAILRNSNSNSNSNSNNNSNNNNNNNNNNNKNSNSNDVFVRCGEPLSKVLLGCQLWDRFTNAIAVDDAAAAALDVSLSLDKHSSSSSASSADVVAIEEEEPQEEEAIVLHSLSQSENTVSWPIAFRFVAKLHEFHIPNDGVSVIGRVPQCFRLRVCDAENQFEPAVIPMRLLAGVPHHLCVRCLSMGVSHESAAIDAEEIVSGVVVSDLFVSVCDMRGEWVEHC